MLKSAWDMQPEAGTADLLLKEKLKAAKASIKEWRRSHINRIGGMMEAAKDKFLALDKLAEERDLTLNEKEQW